MITPRRTVLQNITRVALIASSLFVGTPATRLLKAAAEKNPPRGDDLAANPSAAGGFGQGDCQCGDQGDQGDWGDGDGGDVYYEY